MEPEVQCALISALGPILLLCVKYLLDKKSKSHDKHGPNSSSKQRKNFGR